MNYTSTVTTLLPDWPTLPEWPELPCTNILYRHAVSKAEIVRILFTVFSSLVLLSDTVVVFHTVLKQVIV